MNLSRIKNLSFRAKFSIVGALFMVFGLTGYVLIAQQQQEIRSRAAGTGGTGNCSTVNASSGEALIGDNCTIASGFNGPIIGNNNTIQGGLGGNAPKIDGNGNLIMGGSNGSIEGDGNEVCGGLNGGITGNNNIIHGGVGGPISGTGNQINFGGICGIIRQPTQSPTVAPTQPPATCSDGIDNNQNELIDGQDPACHTDGNQDNPNSYDPGRNEGAVTPTVPQSTPTITIAPTIPQSTPTSSPTLVPTTTVAPGNTSLSLNLLLHGIGKGGDSANPNSGGNPNPLRPQRSVKVEVFNSNNQLVLSKDGTVNFNSVAGNFTGTVDLGTTLASASYSVKIKSTQFLKALVPGIQNITQGIANQLPATVLINGDIDENNSLNILDYNILIGCYSDFLPAPSCTPATKAQSDLDDDGDVNQFDYNLFLRELTNRQGQ